MYNFVLKANLQPVTGNLGEKESAISGSENMQLQHDRYSFFVSAAGLPQDFAFDPFLFVHLEHLHTQSEDALLLFQLLDQKKDKVVAHIPFFLDGNGLAYSPGKAPFGSVQFRKRLPEAVLAEFLELVKRYLLEQKNCRYIRIKSYPFAYAPSESAILTDLFLKQDFQIIHSEINHHILVDEVPIAAKMDAASRRRLKKYPEQGFTFQEENQAFLPEAFSFILQCRLEKGYAWGMTEAQLTKLFLLFPGKFRIFSVRISGELAACTIAVQINQEILYNFSMASAQDFYAYSPAVFLVEGLYRFCQQQNTALLDLGTSNLPSGPNFPLIAFKKHLGGEPGLKLTFEFNAS